MGGWTYNFKSQDGDDIKFYLHDNDSDNKTYGTFSITINKGKENEVDVCFNDIDKLFEVLKKLVFMQFVANRGEVFGWDNYVGYNDVILEMREEKDESISTKMKKIEKKTAIMHLPEGLKFEPGGVLHSDGTMEWKEISIVHDPNYTNPKCAKCGTEEITLPEVLINGLCKKCVD